MGHNAAGASFLRGYLRHGAATEFWTYVEQASHALAFAATARAAGRTEVLKSVGKHTLAALSEAGLMYYPGPDIGRHAWHRAAHGHGAWSLCGVTHTMSSAGAMDAVTALLTAPVQAWDALICTSTAVKDNVSRLLQAQADHLAQRLGAQRLVLPQLPVIPLGIHTQDFAYSDARKAAARAVIGADDDTLVVLYTGHLSLHAKAHPLAMYQALERACATLPAGRKVVLVECGWHRNEAMQQAFADAARFACPSVRVVTLDGRLAEARQTAWAGADVFCSLSDNIEETFGIAPVEAMAAGLPVVVSDWGACKDTVRDGVDGFRIATLMPPAGLGADLALHHALEIDNDDMYYDNACSLVAVDVAAAAHAFATLFASPALRRQMGAAGRERARAVYDWAVIIPHYEALWAQLAELRQAQAPALQALPRPWPARMDPFHAFSSYPTRLLAPDTVFGLADAGMEQALARTAACKALAMVSCATLAVPDEAEVQIVLGALAAGPKPAGELVEAIAAARRPFVYRSLLWLTKMGILKVFT